MNSVFAEKGRYTPTNQPTNHSANHELCYNAIRQIAEFAIFC